MKHHEKEDLAATSGYIFNMIRIPCGEQFRLGDGMSHIAFEKLAHSVQ
jgi:hypothetical protein